MDKLQYLQNINLDKYNYELADERVAKFPLEQRDTSKLLVYNNGAISHHTFNQIPQLLPAGSFLFFNNTKVIPARLFFQKATGSLIEVFLLHPISPSTLAAHAMAAKGTATFECMVGNLKKWKNNEILEQKLFKGKKEINLYARLIDAENPKVELSWLPLHLTLSEILELSGEIPIPPYLNRQPTEADSQTYQTVYAQKEGSVAAPTAGLHFTKEVINNFEQKGIGCDYITLHVGAGTFRPVKVKDLTTHPMHNEQIVFTKKNIENCLLHHTNAIAVGTTSARSLESLYWYGVQLITTDNKKFFIDKLTPYTSVQNIAVTDSLQAVLSHMQTEQIESLTGETELLIAPGYEFKICKGLITNFHQPSSTLLLLVDAFVHGQWKDIYNEALTNDYRFLSYGDSSLLLP